MRIDSELPKTATSKILKRELIHAGVTAGDGVLWERVARGTSYREVPSASGLTGSP